MKYSLAQAFRPPPLLDSPSDTPDCPAFPINAKSMRLDDDWHRNWLKDVNPRNEDRMKKIREGNFTENVNWLTVYKQLVVLKKGVLGVRNRARVWYLGKKSSRGLQI